MHVSDLLPILEIKKDKDEGKQPEGEVEEKEIDEDSEDEEDEEENDARVEFFILKGFIKPLKLLARLSNFGNLIALYKILVSLAVTSCSHSVSIEFLSCCTMTAKLSILQAECSEERGYENPKSLIFFRFPDKNPTR